MNPAAIATTTPASPAVRRQGISDLLAIGCGASVAQWAIAYFARLFEETLASPGWTFGVICGVVILLAAAQVAAGFVAGRFTHRGVRGGVLAGLITGFINLLAVAAMVGGDQPNEVRPSAALWMPGSVLAAMVLGALGAVAGRLRRPAGDPPRDWIGGPAVVTACATFMLLAIGGVVTGTDEGLAVVDWPNTEKYNMFLYPVERMTGGVFLEHSHRLFGSLVGLATIVLAIQTQVTERRAWVKQLAWAALLLVVVQGVLGGLRVTGHLTLSDRPEDTNPSVLLAIVHGVLGQVVFGVIAAVAVVRTRLWRAGGPPADAPGVSTDRFLTGALVVLLVAQLVLGALVRHLTWALQELRYGLETPPAVLVERGQWALTLHITVAVLVALVALGVGTRMLALYRGVGPLRRLGISLMILVGVQLAVGILALVVTGDDAPTRRPQTLDVLVTTLHQVIGAALLAWAIMLLLWSLRLLRDPGRGSVGLRPAV